MSIKALQIAEWMLARARIDGEPLTNLKLQKLVYIANGWHLGFEGRPLFPEAVEAWPYGPVVPKVYQTYKAYGAGGIDSIGCRHSFAGRVNAVLETVWTAYANLSAVQLVALTHKSRTPWSLTYRDGEGRGETIPTERIRLHYSDLATTYATKQPA